MKGWFHWSNAVTWCVTWKNTTVVKGGECILTWYVKGKKTQQNAKKMTITSGKNLYTKNKTKNKNKQKKAAELPVTLLLAAGRSRVQDNTEPGAWEISTKKLTRKNKKREDLPSFSPCTLSKTRSGLHNLNSALFFLVLCSETARKRLLHWLRWPSKNRLDPG